VASNGRLRRTSAVTWGATIVLLALAVGGLYLWRSSRVREAPRGASPPVTVTTMVVQPEDAPVDLEAVGSVTAVRQVVLTPEVGGLVTEIHFESGDQVEAKQLLVRLNDAPERAERESASARQELAERQLARTERLARTGVASQDLVDQSRSERDQAVAAVEQLDALIAQKQIRAPFAGELGLRRINLGQHLNPGDAIATLTDLGEIYAEFAVPQQELNRFAPGATVSVTTDAWPGRTFTGKVNAIEPQIDVSTRNATIQALLKNQDHALRPGMYVNVALSLPPEHGALLVPVTAIQTSAAGENVIVVRGGSAEAGGTADMVPVVTGRRIDDRVVVASGLHAGDVVVIEGQLRVQPGATVRSVPSTLAGGG
jgi:membrane fusion protein, multidrug efflux system